MRCLQDAGVLRDDSGMENEKDKRKVEERE